MKAASKQTIRQSSFSSALHLFHIINCHLLLYLTTALLFLNTIIVSTHGASIHPTTTTTNVSALLSSSSASALKSSYSSLSPQSCIASFLPSYLQSIHLSSKSHSSSTTSATSMRAWTCHGRTHKEMIDRLSSAGIIQSPLVKEALLRVDRANYVLNSEYAYMDAPQQMYVLLSCRLRCILSVYCIIESLIC